MRKGFRHEFSIIFFFAEHYQNRALMFVSLAKSTSLLKLTTNDIMKFWICFLHITSCYFFSEVIWKEKEMTLFDFTIFIRKKICNLSKTDKLSVFPERDVFHLDWPVPVFEVNIFKFRHCYRTHSLCRNTSSGFYSTIVLCMGFISL